MTFVEKIMFKYPAIDKWFIFVSIEKPDLVTVITCKDRVVMFDQNYAGELQGEYLDEDNEWCTLPADDVDLHCELGLISYSL